jgi:hypothetical protein
VIFCIVMSIYHCAYCRVKKKFKVLILRAGALEL